MKKLLQVIVLVMAVVACIGGCNLRQGFQPLPPMFKNWAKEGDSPEEVKAALLACGYDNPYNGFQTHKKVALNELIRADRCMEEKGFHYLLSDRKSICDDKYYSTFPACTKVQP